MSGSISKSQAIFALFLCTILLQASHCLTAKAKGAPQQTPLLTKSIASLKKGQRLPSATPSYYRSSFNRNGKKYVQIWFKLNSSLQNQDTYFTIFKGRVITKTRRQFKVKVYLNLKTHRIYYTDDRMKPKGRLVSAKIPKNAGLTKNWHYFYIGAEYLGNSESPKGPRFETCISVDSRPCKRVRSVANKDGWKKIKGRFMTDDLSKAAPVSSFDGLIYGAVISDRLNLAGPENLGVDALENESVPNGRVILARERILASIDSALDDDPEDRKVISNAAVRDELEKVIKNLLAAQNSLKKQNMLLRATKSKYEARKVHKKIKTLLKLVKLALLEKKILTNPQQAVQNSLKIIAKQKIAIKELRLVIKSVDKFINYTSKTILEHQIKMKIFGGSGKIANAVKKLIKQDKAELATKWKELTVAKRDLQKARSTVNAQMKISKILYRLNKKGYFMNGGTVKKLKTLLRDAKKLAVQVNFYLLKQNLGAKKVKSVKSKIAFSAKDAKYSWTEIKENCLGPAELTNCEICMKAQRATVAKCARGTKEAKSQISIIKKKIATNESQLAKLPKKSPKAIKFKKSLTHLGEILASKRKLIAGCERSVRVAKRRIGKIGRFIRKAKVYESLKKIQLGKNLKNSKMVKKIQHQMSVQMKISEARLAQVKKFMESEDPKVAMKAKLQAGVQRKEILRINTIKLVLKNPTAVVQNAKKMILAQEKIVQQQKLNKKKLQAKIVIIKMTIMRSQIITRRYVTKTDELTLAQKVKYQTAKKILAASKQNLVIKKLSLKKAKKILKYAKRTVRRQFRVLKITKKIKKSAVKNLGEFKRSVKVSAKKSVVKSTARKSQHNKILKAKLLAVQRKQLEKSELALSKNEIALSIAETKSAKAKIAKKIRKIKRKVAKVKLMKKVLRNPGTQGRAAQKIIEKRKVIIRTLTIRIVKYVEIMTQITIMIHRQQELITHYTEIGNEAMVAKAQAKIQAGNNRMVKTKSEIKKMKKTVKRAKQIVRRKKSLVKMVKVIRKSLSNGKKASITKLMGKIADIKVNFLPKAPKKVLTPKKSRVVKKKTNQFVVMPALPKVGSTQPKKVNQILKSKAKKVSLVVQRASKKVAGLSKVLQNKSNKLMTHMQSLIKLTKIMAAPSKILAIKNRIKVTKKQISLAKKSVAKIEGTVKNAKSNLRKYKKTLKKSQAKISKKVYKPDQLFTATEDELEVIDGSTAKKSKATAKKASKKAVKKATNATTAKKQKAEPIVVSKVEVTRKINQLIRKPLQIQRRLQVSIKQAKKAQAQAAQQLQLQNSRLKIAQQTQNIILITQINETIRIQKQISKKQAKILKTEARKLKKTKKAILMISKPKELVKKSQLEVTKAKLQLENASNVIQTESSTIKHTSVVITELVQKMETAIALNRESEVVSLRKEIEAQKDLASKARTAVIEAKSSARKQKRLIKREHRLIKKTARIERAVMKISQPAKPIPKKAALKKIAAKQGKAMKILKKKTAKLAAKKSRVVKRLLTAQLQVQNLKAQMKKGGPKARAIAKKIRIVRRRVLRIRGVSKRLGKKVQRQERRQAKVEATIALLKDPEASVAVAKQQSKSLETQIQETHVVITQIVTVITRIVVIIRQRIQLIAQYKKQGKLAEMKKVEAEVAAQRTKLVKTKAKLKSKKAIVKTQKKIIAAHKIVLGMVDKVKTLVKTVVKNAAIPKKVVKKRYLARQAKRVQKITQKVMKSQAAQVKLESTVQKMLITIKGTKDRSAIKKATKKLRKLRRALKATKTKVAKKQRALKSAKMTVSIINNPKLVKSVKKDIQKARKEVRKSRTVIQRSVRTLMEIKIQVQEKRESIAALKKSGKTKQAQKLQQIIARKQRLATQAKILIQSQKKKMLKLNRKIRQTKKIIRVARKANKIVVRKTTLNKLVKKKRTPSALKSILTFNKPKKSKSKLATQSLTRSFKKSIARQKFQLAAKRIERKELLIKLKEKKSAMKGNFNLDQVQKLKISIQVAKIAFTRVSRAIIKKSTAITSKKIIMQVLRGPQLKVKRTKKILKVAKRAVKKVRVRLANLKKVVRKRQRVIRSKMNIIHRMIIEKKSITEIKTLRHRVRSIQRKVSNVQGKRKLEILMLKAAKAKIAKQKKSMSRARAKVRKVVKLAAQAKSTSRRVVKRKFVKIQRKKLAQAKKSMAKKLETQQGRQRAYRKIQNSVKKLQALPKVAVEKKLAKAERAMRVMKKSVVGAKRRLNKVTRKIQVTVFIIQAVAKPRTQMLKAKTIIQQTVPKIHQSIKTVIASKFKIQKANAAIASQKKLIKTLNPVTHATLIAQARQVIQQRVNIIQSTTKILSKNQQAIKTLKSEVKVQNKLAKIAGKVSKSIRKQARAKNPVQKIIKATAPVDGKKYKVKMVHKQNRIIVKVNRRIVRMRIVKRRQVTKVNRMRVILSNAIKVVKSAEKTNVASEDLGKAQKAVAVAKKTIKSSKKRILRVKRKIYLKIRVRAKANIKKRVIGGAKKLVRKVKHAIRKITVTQSTAQVASKKAKRAVVKIRKLLVIQKKMISLYKSDKNPVMLQAATLKKVAMKKKLLTKKKAAKKAKKLVKTLNRKLSFKKKLIVTVKKIKKVIRAKKINANPILKMVKTLKPKTTQKFATKLLAHKQTMVKQTENRMQMKIKRIEVIKAEIVKKMNIVTKSESQTMPAREIRMAKKMVAIQKRILKKMAKSVKSVEKALVKTRLQVEILKEPKKLLPAARKAVKALRNEISLEKNAQAKAKMVVTFQRKILAQRKVRLQKAILTSQPKAKIEKMRVSVERQRIVFKSKSNVYKARRVEISRIRKDISVRRQVLKTNSGIAKTVARQVLKSLQPQTPKQVKQQLAKKMVSTKNAATAQLVKNRQAEVTIKNNIKIQKIQLAKAKATIKDEFKRGQLVEKLQGEISKRQAKLVQAKKIIKKNQKVFRVAQRKISFIMKPKSVIRETKRVIVRKLIQVVKIREQIIEKKLQITETENLITKQSQKVEIMVKTAASQPATPDGLKIKAKISQEIATARAVIETQRKIVSKQHINIEKKRLSADKAKAVIVKEKKVIKKARKVERTVMRKALPKDSLVKIVSKPKIAKAKVSTRIVVRRLARKAKAGVLKIQKVVRRQTRRAAIIQGKVVEIQDEIKKSKAARITQPIILQLEQKLRKNQTLAKKAVKKVALKKRALKKAKLVIRITREPRTLIKKAQKKIFKMAKQIVHQRKAVHTVMRSVISIRKVIKIQTQRIKTLVIQKRLKVIQNIRLAIAGKKRLLVKKQALISTQRKVMAKSKQALSRTKKFIKIAKKINKKIRKIIKLKNKAKAGPKVSAKARVTQIRKLKKTRDLKIKKVKKVMAKQRKVLMIHKKIASRLQKTIGDQKLRIQKAIIAGKHSEVKLQQMTLKKMKKQVKPSLKKVQRVQMKIRRRRLALKVYKKPAQVLKASIRKIVAHKRVIKVTRLVIRKIQHKVVQMKRIVMDQHVVLARLTGKKGADPVEKKRVLRIIKETKARMGRLAKSVKAKKAKIQKRAQKIDKKRILVVRAKALVVKPKPAVLKAQKLTRAAKKLVKRQRKTRLVMRKRIFAVRIRINKYVAMGKPASVQKLKLKLVNKQASIRVVGKSIKRAARKIAAQKIRIQISRKPVTMYKTSKKVIRVVQKSIRVQKTIIRKIKVQTRRIYAVIKNTMTQFKTALINKLPITIVNTLKLKMKQQTALANSRKQKIVLEKAQVALHRRTLKKNLKIVTKTVKRAKKVLAKGPKLVRNATTQKVKAAAKIALEISTRAQLIIGKTKLAVRQTKQALSQKIKDLQVAILKRDPVIIQKIRKSIILKKTQIKNSKSQLLNARKQVKAVQLTISKFQKPKTTVKRVTKKLAKAKKVYRAAKKVVRILGRKIGHSKAMVAQSKRALIELEKPSDRKTAVIDVEMLAHRRVIAEQTTEIDRVQKLVKAKRIIVVRQRKTIVVSRKVIREVKKMLPVRQDVTAKKVAVMAKSRLVIASAKQVLRGSAKLLPKSRMIIAECTMKLNKAIAQGQTTKVAKLMASIKSNKRLIKTVHRAKRQIVTAKLRMQTIAKPLKLILKASKGIQKRVRVIRRRRVIIRQRRIEVRRVALFVKQQNVVLFKQMHQLETAKSLNIAGDAAKAQAVIDKQRESISKASGQLAGLKIEIKKGKRVVHQARKVNRKLALKIRISRAPAKVFLGEKRKISVRRVRVLKSKLILREKAKKAIETRRILAVNQKKYKVEKDEGKRAVLRLAIDTGLAARAQMQKSMVRIQRRIIKCQTQIVRSQRTIHISNKITPASVKTQIVARKTVKSSQARISTQKSEIRIFRSEIRHNSTLIIKQRAIIREASTGFGQGAIIEEAKLKIQQISEQVKMAKQSVKAKKVQVRQFKRIIRAVKAPHAALKTQSKKIKVMNKIIEHRRVKVLTMGMKISRMVQFVKSKRLIRRVMMFKRQLFSAKQVTTKVIRIKAQIAQYKHAQAKEAKSIRRLTEQRRVAKKLVSKAKKVLPKKSQAEQRQVRVKTIIRVKISGMRMQAQNLAREQSHAVQIIRSQESIIKEARSSDDKTLVLQAQATIRAQREVFNGAKKVQRQISRKIKAAKLNTKVLAAPKTNLKKAQVQIRSARRILVKSRKIIVQKRVVIRRMRRVMHRHVNMVQNMIIKGVSAESVSQAKQMLAQKQSEMSQYQKAFKKAQQNVQLKTGVIRRAEVTVKLVNKVLPNLKKGVVIAKKKVLQAKTKLRDQKSKLSSARKAYVQQQDNLRRLVEENASLSEIQRVKQLMVQQTTIIHNTINIIRVVRVQVRRVVINMRIERNPKMMFLKAQTKIIKFNGVKRRMNLQIKSLRSEVKSINAQIAWQGKLAAQGERQFNIESHTAAEKRISQLRAKAAESSVRIIAGRKKAYKLAKKLQEAKNVALKTQKKIKKPAKEIRMKTMLVHQNRTRIVNMRTSILKIESQVQVLNQSMSTERQIMNSQQTSVSENSAKMVAGVRREIRVQKMEIRRLMALKAKRVLIIQTSRQMIMVTGNPKHSAQHLRVAMQDSRAQVVTLRRTVAHTTIVVSRSETIIRQTQIRIQQLSTISGSSSEVRRLERLVSMEQSKSAEARIKMAIQSREISSVQQKAKLNSKILKVANRMRPRPTPAQKKTQEVRREIKMVESKANVQIQHSSSIISDLKILIKTYSARGEFAAADRLIVLVAKREEKLRAAQGAIDQLKSKKK